MRGAGTLAEQGPTGWYTADLTLDYELGRSTLAAGSTANFHRTDQTRFATTDWLAAASPAFQTQTFGKTRQVGAWGEARLGVFDALTLTAGVRYNHWRAYDGGLARIGVGGAPVSNLYAERNDDFVNPSLSATYAVSGRTKAQLSLATATRFPTVGELFQGSLNSDGTFNLNSFDPNLRPERSPYANLLIAHDLGRVRLTASAFYQRVRDALFPFRASTRTASSPPRTATSNRRASTASI